MGGIENSSRGVWSVTEQGRSLAASVEAVRESYRETRRRLDRAWRSKSDPTQTDHETASTDAIGKHDASPDGELTGEPDGGGEWQDTLLSTLKGMPPDAFERLCRRILLQSGFTRVEVTGRSGDGGIDGVGVLRIELISFQIVFQCKRYTGSVGAGAIREFRGSLDGRADKGLFLTTGQFTRDAQREAVRDGAAAIDLIDGTEICNLLRQLGLGVKTIEQVVVEPAFFDSI